MAIKLIGNYPSEIQQSNNIRPCNVNPFIILRDIMLFLERNLLMIDNLACYGVKIYMRTHIDPVK